MGVTAFLGLGDRAWRRPHDRAGARWVGGRRQPAGRGGDVLADDPALNPRVLLVEDEDRIASFIVKGLGARGFDVRRVADGASVDEALAAGADVVVLDLGLPDEDGLEVLARLRARGRTVPVVILTA